MRKLVALVLVSLSLPAGIASADGPGSGSSVNVLFGYQGVAAPDGSVRYVALTTGRRTIVSVIRIRDGRVMRWRVVRGFVGVPVVTLDGRSTGLSHDGKTLVLADTGGTETRFAVVDTHTLRVRALRLRDTWSFDAISPDGSKLYLVEYLNAERNAPYRVRLYDLRARRLVREPVVDRREAEERLMRGRPVTRATSQDGRWAYTLYARARGEPFVHALDTIRARAFCIDLPLEQKLRAQLALRLKLSGARLVVHAAGRPVALVDTDSFEVRKL